MLAHAPGKLVLSGAYAVLGGAPAIVTAVDRYVVADAGRPPSFLAPEVSAALSLLGREGQAPWYDASELRAGDRKLGLGSSAAIVVASVAALLLDDQALPLDDQALPLDDQNCLPEDGDLARRLLDVSLRAHRQAQGGGSGIDVVTSAWGGTLCCRRVLGPKGSLELEAHPIALPRKLVLQAWASPKAASTKDLLGQVRALDASSPETHARWMAAQARGAEAAVTAFRDGSAAGMVSALRAQYEALAGLGAAAEAPIVTPALAQLWAAIPDPGRGAVLPAGAGGGDINWYVGLEAPSTPWKRLAIDLGLVQLDLSFGARGVHATAGSEE